MKKKVLVFTWYDAFKVKREEKIVQLVFKKANIQNGNIPADELTLRL